MGGGSVAGLIVSISATVCRNSSVSTSFSNYRAAPMLRANSLSSRVTYVSERKIMGICWVFGLLRSLYANVNPSIMGIRISVMIDAGCSKMDFYQRFLVILGCDYWIAFESQGTSSNSRTFRISATTRSGPYGIVIGCILACFG